MASAGERRKHILALLDEKRFLSVRNLGELCQVSEMTVRRDLRVLEEQGLLRRTFGGAVPLRSVSSLDKGAAGEHWTRPAKGKLADRLDVLVATAVSPGYDRLLLERVGRRRIPIIAESIQVLNASTLVAVDNFGAAWALGQWAGEYAGRTWDGKAALLDLTYHLSNTQARSKGFLAGLRQALPGAVNLLSLNAQSRYDVAYQLTRDALLVHGEINLIFAINDIVAWGAINACQDLGLDPADLLVLPFGLEGNTLRNALHERRYCRAGLAMFPEVVGPACVEAAIAAYNHLPLPEQIITRHAVITSESLENWYARENGDWILRPAADLEQLAFSAEQLRPGDGAALQLPHSIGMLVPFMEHEWYRSLVAAMQAHAARYQMEIEIVDADQSHQDEVDQNRREIAQAAAQLVQPGEVILIDGGPLATCLAEALCQKEGLTVITNAVAVFDILRGNPGTTLISTGGAYRTSSQMLVGPTAEGALRELRADKAFLEVAGITLDFGLSHTHISEVTMKQAMIRSARQVILLADHTLFQQPSTVQVAPLTAVNILVTNDSLPASIRLDLSKLGIQIILASS